MLHPVTGSQSKVVDAVGNALTAFRDNNSVVQEKLATAFPDPSEREKARQQILANLDQAYGSAATEENRDTKWFASRDPMAGIAQSAMNVRAQTRVAAQRRATATTAEAVFEQFGPLDPGWIECVIDGFKTSFDGNAPFATHDVLSDFLHPISNQATIALVADWGANNDAAKRVARQIREAKPDIVIHLGDIYYAGQQNEAEEALKIWPLADSVSSKIPPGSSFALNGNHEMFSGGWGYFGTILERLGQKASYFGLRNDYWQFLAFDSAYVEQRLLPPEDATGDNADLRGQWDWLVDKMKNSTLPAILLSHHQPISAFSDEHEAATNLRADFAKFLSAAGRAVFGWFFGHEHRCVIYGPTAAPYFARLIGHGCIPHAADSATQADPGCAPFLKMNTRTNAEGDAVSGFALLKCDNRKINIRYIDEDGGLFLEEGWVAPLPSDAKSSS